jgi:Bacterial Ig-like domain
MYFSRHLWWSGLVIAGLTAGCAGNGEGLNQQGEQIGSSSSSSGGSTSSGGAVTADFQSIQDNVFTPICSKCHIGASAPEGLQLDAAHSFNLLVGVPSAEDGSLDRVKPGDPDHSYMVLKIEGAAGIVGGQMPLGETPLPQATINAVRQWIMDGASNAASSQTASLTRAITQAAANPFAIESTAPMDGAVVAAPFRQVVVAFTHAVDASLVNDTTVTLESVTPGDDGASHREPLAALAALSESNQFVLLITPRTALAAGLYRVHLRGIGAAALADVDATVLGTDAEFEFTVENAR